MARAWGDGSIEQRGEKHFVLRVSHKRDPATGKRSRETRVFHGTRRQATAALAEMVKRRQAHGPTPASGGAVTLDAWVKRQIAHGVSRKSGKPRSARTKRDQLELWTRYSTPALRAVALRDVSTAGLRAAVADLFTRKNDYTGEKLAPRTIQVFFSVVRAALYAAVDDGILSVNPAIGVGVKGGGATSKVGQALTREELEQLLAATEGDRYHALWAVAAYTGARPGEILGLRWSDWDRKAGTLSFTRTLVRVGKALFFEGCKADSERGCPVPAPLRQALQEHEWRQRAEVQRVNKGCAPSESRWVDPTLMFTTEVGSALEQHNVAARFRRALTAAKVRPVRLYDLRHSFGTLMVGSGTDPKTVAELMGHRDVRLTLAQYTHPDTAGKRQAVDRVWAPVAAPAQTG
jgi:integrase